MATVFLDKRLLRKVVTDRTNQAMTEIGNNMVSKIQHSMDSTARGKRVRIRGRTHHVSLPGNPPAPFTRRLYNSISWATSTGLHSTGMGEDSVNRPRYVYNSITLSIGSNVPYALQLELKGKHNRPYLWPALWTGRGIIQTAFKKAFTVI